MNYWPIKRTLINKALLHVFLMYCSLPHTNLMWKTSSPSTIPDHISTCTRPGHCWRGASLMHYIAADPLFSMPHYCSPWYLRKPSYQLVTIAVARCVLVHHTIRFSVVGDLHRAATRKHHADIFQAEWKTRVQGLGPGRKKMLLELSSNSWLAAASHTAITWSWDAAQFRRSQSLLCSHVQRCGLWTVCLLPDHDGHRDESLLERARVALEWNLSSHHC